MIPVKLRIVPHNEQSYKGVTSLSENEPGKENEIEGLSGKIFFELPLH